MAEEPTHASAKLERDLAPLYAEFAGTAAFATVLTLSIVINSMDSIMVAISAGFTMTGLWYSLKEFSGCHLNPAVTLGKFIAGLRHPATNMDPVEMVYYFIAQFIGQFAGVGLAYVIILSMWGDVYALSEDDISKSLGAPGYKHDNYTVLNYPYYYTELSAATFEIILTFVYVLVFVGATSKTMASHDRGHAGLAIGLALTVATLVGFEVTGAALNPWRGIVPGLVVQGDRIIDALGVFFFSPLIGGAAAGAAYLTGFMELTEDAEDEPEVAL